MKSVPTVSGRAVLLPGHRDEFGDPGFHYHIDWKYEPGEVRQEDVVFSEEAPVYKNRKQIREIVDVTGGIISVSLMLANKYRGRKVECNTCPHQGIQLQENGKCPAHALSVDANGCIDADLHLVCGGVSVPATFQGPTQRVEFTMKEDGFVDQIELVNSRGVVLSTLPLSNIAYCKGDIIRVILNNKK